MENLVSTYILMRSFPVEKLIYWSDKTKAVLTPIAVHSIVARNPRIVWNTISNSYSPASGALKTNSKLSSSFGKIVPNPEFGLIVTNVGKSKKPYSLLCSHVCTLN